MFFNFYMRHHLHEFVRPFTLYLNVENATNPTWKHFDKTNILQTFKMDNRLDPTGFSLSTERNYAMKR